MATENFRRRFRALCLGVAALSLSACATTSTGTATPPSTATTITTGVTNIVTDITPVLPSNVQSVVGKITSGITKACGYAPFANSIIGLINANATVTTVGDVVNMVCTAYNNATTGKVSLARKVGARRVGG